MADDLKLKASFDDKASAGVRKLGKTLADLKPSHGMAAAQKWMEGFHKGADRTVGALRPVSGMLNSVGVGGLAASLSIGEMVKQFKELADSTLTMRELSRQSRISATDLARLQFAAGKLHVDPAAMSGAIGSWSSKMVEFRMHTSQFYRDLMRQNADVAARIESDSPIDGLKRALDFISRIKDPQIQKRWADDAGLGDLAPMLGKGPDGLAAAFAEAGREVKPITEEMQAAADRFNDATNRFNQTWANFKNDLGPSVLDPLSHTLDKLDDGLKLAAKYPGDAAAAAATIAGSFAALYLRARIMRGSKLAGGTEMGAAAGEMTGAAREQAKAGGSLIEAARELQIAAKELQGRGGVGGSPRASGEPEKPGEGPGKRSPAGASLLDKAFSLLMLKDLAETARDEHAIEPPKSFDKRGILNFLDPNLGNLVLGPSASDKWKVPSAYDREARARGGLGVTPGSNLKKDIAEGSKEGIIAGLREMAQQQELAEAYGQGGTGAPNFRYGRNPASGGFRRTPGSGHGGQAGTGPQGPLHFAGFGSGGWEKAGASKEQVAAYIRQAAAREGIDPETAVRVAQSEGLGVYRGDYGTSFGPFQLHYGGSGIRGMNSGGLGDSFTKETGLDARDPATWKAQVDYAMKQARRGGWTPWHGAARVGIGPRQGIGVRPIVPAPLPSTPGAGTPAPSAAAQTAADAFKAHQKALNGTPPQAHAAGGAIRGPGGPRSDSILSWLSNGEFVVNAGAAGRFGPLLHAINNGRMPAYADGGPVGFGVDRRFYPTSSPKISEAEGHDNRRSWRDFFRRSPKLGGMGASWRTTLGALAMIQGESGRGINSKLYGWDANGPSGGVAQWHDVTEGRLAGKLHRLSDAMTGAMLQHVDWQDRTFQQSYFRKEAQGSMWWAWRKMLNAKTARGALKEGIDKFENPADHEGQLRRRMPNIVRLQREALADGAGSPQELGPLDVTIRHHPHTGKPIVSARAGKGSRLRIRTAPTMRPT